MNREWKKCAGGALAVLLGFGIADRCFGKNPEDYTVEGLQRLWDNSLNRVTENIQKTRIRNILNEIDEELSTAFKATERPKARVFDSRKHALQAEYLKLIQKTSSKTNRTLTEQATTKAALRALRRLCRNPIQKPLFVRALASAIGGSKWIPKYIPNDPAELATQAIQVLLKLSEHETLLNNNDCLKVRQQLYRHQVFPDAQSPFWAAVRSLTPLEREQLGDCLGDYPRSIYEKRREYFRIYDKRIDLQIRILEFYRQNKEVRQLVDYFIGYHRINLTRNGFEIPGDFSMITPELISDLRNGTLPRIDNDRHIYQFLALLGFCPWPNEIREKWDTKKLCITRELITEQTPSPKTLNLIQQFTEAQRLFYPHFPDYKGRDTCCSLEEKEQALYAEFPQEDFGAYGSYPRPIFPSREGCFRRDLMAGKPYAQTEDADSTGTDHVYIPTRYRDSDSDRVIGNQRMGHNPHNYNYWALEPRLPGLGQ
jgi:hypothetical protein